MSEIADKTARIADRTQEIADKTSRIAERTQEIADKSTPESRLVK